MKKYSLGALVAAGLLVGGLSAGSASAADLGGNCCADLEERIAELEATTARKGNRKVSLTISGWVAQQVMWWDDGAESNVYVGDIGATLSSHFKMTGQATIMPGWYAGYVLHVELRNNNSLSVTNTQPGDTNPFSGDDSNGQSSGFGEGFGVLQSFWFLKSDQLGKVSVGKQSQASDNTAILVDGSGSLVPANWVAFDYASFQFRTTGGDLKSAYGFIGACIGGGAIGDCNGGTQNVVRYDSPVFGGFSVSASWGEDDMWDVAARYAGEMGGFKIAAAAAYDENTSENFLGTFFSGDTNKYFQVGGYIEHVATGVFAYGAYGHNEFDLATGDSETYYVKGGLRERWTPLGHTVLYGEYEKSKSDGDLAAYVGTGATDTDFQLYGGGIVQEIDAAAMSIWLSYRHLEFEDNSPDEYEDFDYVKFGALINF